MRGVNVPAAHKGAGWAKRGAAALAGLGVAMLAACAPTQLSGRTDPQTALFVSPQGDDTGPGTLERPFATIAHAQEAARALAPSMSGDIVVNLRTGLYTLTEPLKFGAADSGQNGHRIIYRAFGYGTARQEEPVVSGGRRISGWTLSDAEHGIWRADVGDLETRQLYINGRRARMATLGGFIPGNVTKTDFGYVTDSAEPRSWRRPQDIEFEYLRAYWWTGPRCGLDRIEAGPGSTTRLIMDQPCFGWLRARVPNLVDPTALQNSLSFLADPGDFYLDRTTPGAHALYYIPQPSEDLAQAEVVAPVLESLIIGEGSAERPLSNVAFQGLTFAYATWLAPGKTSGYVHYFLGVYDGGEVPQGPIAPSTGAQLVPGGIAISNSRNILFENNRIAHFGGAGLTLSGSVDNVVRGNDIGDISQSAVIVGGLMPADNTGNRVENNWIHDAGFEYAGGVGVWMLQTANSVISHNQVNNIGNSGIAVTSLIGTTGHYNARIADNRVFDALRVLNEGGGIYVSGAQGTSAQDRTIVSGNVVHSVVHPPGIGTGMGIFLDFGLEWTKLEPNILYRAPNVFGGCSRPTMRNVEVASQFVDESSQEWGCGPTENVSVQDVVLLGRDRTERACELLPECARIDEKAGLEARYRPMLTANRKP